MIQTPFLTAQLGNAVGRQRSQGQTLEILSGNYIFDGPTYLTAFLVSDPSHWKSCCPTAFSVSDPSTRNAVVRQHPLLSAPQVNRRKCILLTVFLVLGSAARNAVVQQRSSRDKGTRRMVGQKRCQATAFLSGTIENAVARQWLTQTL